MSVMISDERIAVTRITVHDVYYYQLKGRTHEEIASILGISVAQVEAAARYAVDHAKELHAVYERIEARNSSGNPPAVEATRRESRARMTTWLADRATKERCLKEFS